MCFKCWKIHDKCFKHSYGKWSKHNHLFHCKEHFLPCLQCKSLHAPSSQSTLKRYVHNKHVHYMTEKCAEAFNTKQPHSIYMHDAFFDTWCYDISIFNNWLYHIKTDSLSLFI